ncbi:hypothetical protein LCGC14_1952220, partial [marine sediment metagenome]
LRSVEPKALGRRGGTLVEVLVADRIVSNVAQISSSLGARFIGKYDTLIAWDDKGRCRLKKPKAR